MASNIGGTATLIGDPPNIIIASRAGLTFNDFLRPPGPDRRGAARRASSALCWLLFRSRARATTPSVPSGDGAGRAARRSATRACWCSAGRRARPGAGRLRAARRHCTWSPRWWPCSVPALPSLSPACRTAVYLEDVEWETLRRSSPACSSWSAAWSQTGRHRRPRPTPLDRPRSATTTRSAAMGCSSARPCSPAIIDNIPYVATMAPIVDELVGAARRPRRAAVAVVGPRPRRRPRRQRHRHRRQRQRRRPRHRQAERPPDPASGSSPSTGWSSPPSPSPSASPTSCCATSCWPDESVAGPLSPRRRARAFLVLDQVHHRRVGQRGHVAHLAVLGDVLEQAAHDLAGAGLRAARGRS